jgi:hypothetical protein
MNQGGKMNVKRRVGAVLTAVAALATGVFIAFGLPAGADVSLQSESPSVASVTLGSTGVLSAHGAAVTVPVTVVCQPGAYAFVYLTIYQRTGNDIAVGSEYVNVSCTGSPQTLEVVVNPYPKPFHPNVAYGSATLTQCLFTCTSVTDEHVIRLVTKA